MEPETVVTPENSALRDRTAAQSSGDIQTPLLEEEIDDASHQPEQAEDRSTSSAFPQPIPDLDLRLLEKGFHSSPAGLCVLDLGFRYMIVNNNFAKMQGLPRSHFLGRTVSEALPHLAAQIIRHLENSLATELQSEVELVVEQMNPRTGFVETLSYLRTAQPMRGDDGAIVGFSVALFDITERQHTLAALRESEEDLRYTVDLNPNVPFTADAQGNLLSLSARFLTMTGLTREQANLSGWGDAIHEQDRANVWRAWHHSIEAGDPFDQVYRLLYASGEYRWVQGRALPRRLPNGSIVRWYGTLEDVHERTLLSEALKLKTARLEEVGAQLALRVRKDHLTGLYNRRHFDDALSRECSRSRRSGQPLALIMIDVDRFKRFNDTYGHPAGDACLRAVAGALGKVLRRQGDLAARYGGEEFVVLLPDTPEDGAMAVAEHVLSAVRALALPHAASVTGIVSVSAGVAVLQSSGNPVDPGPPADLVQCADLALYAAKSGGRDRVTKYLQIPTISPLPKD